MSKEAIERIYDYCVHYLDGLNSNQVHATWEYINILNKHGEDKEYDLMTKLCGRVAILDYLFKLKENKRNLLDEIVYDRLSSIWTVMIGMYLVQDEYNRFNKNYKSKVK